MIWALQPVLGVYRDYQPEASQQVEQQSQQVTAEQIDNFKKAFSACLEGNQYMVRY